MRMISQKLVGHPRFLQDCFALLAHWKPILDDNKLLNYVIIDTSSSFASNLPHDYRFFTNIFKSQRDSKVRPIFFQFNKIARK